MDTNYLYMKQFVDYLIYGTVASMKNQLSGNATPPLVVPLIFVNMLISMNLASIYVLLIKVILIPYYFVLLALVLVLTFEIYTVYGRYREIMAKYSKQHKKVMLINNIYIIVTFIILFIAIKV